MLPTRVLAVWVDREDAVEEQRISKNDRQLS
jgi:hypothetical protein